MSDEPMPKRIRIDTDELTSLSREDLIEKFQEQESYVRFLEKSRSRSADGADDDDCRGSEEKLKQQNIEAARRENTLVLRLTNKEQELQDCLNQISEMKQAQTQSTAQLRSMLLDPALNLVFQRMSKEVDESKEKLKQTQNELSAWKFTPDSQTGKKLMARCRMLLHENEELGKMIASGRTAELEGQLALQKTLVQEMKKNQEELDEFVGEMDEDVEGMQSMIYVLQTQLKDAKEQMAKLQAENEQLRIKSLQLQQQQQHQQQHQHHHHQHHYHRKDPSPVSNGGKHIVNHTSHNPKPETPQASNNQTAPAVMAVPAVPPVTAVTAVTAVPAVPATPATPATPAAPAAPAAPAIKHEPTDTQVQIEVEVKVKPQSPVEKGNLNNICPESSRDEAMETDSPTRMNSSGSSSVVDKDKDQPGCDSGEWETADRTTTPTQANSHGLSDRVLSADSTSCQDNTDATSSDAWSPQNSKTTDDNGAEETVSLTDKTTLHGGIDAPLLSTLDLKPVRNGVEQVTQLESEEEV